MSSYSFKVVLLGQGCVGKTSLVLRYISNVFKYNYILSSNCTRALTSDSHQSTLQASFLKKQIYLDQDLVRLNIWDTAGQEKFHALGPIYYREADGALLVYDVMNPESLQKVRDWVRELNKMLGKDNIKLAIIGNKVDLLPLVEQKSLQNNALIQEAIQFTNELQNAKHYVTSAKLNSGISQMFISLSKRMVEQANRHLANRDNKSSLVRSRILKTLLVTDDRPSSNNEDVNDSDKYGRTNKGININSRENGSRNESNCGCWR